jgi:hypothetical protein
MITTSAPTITINDDKLDKNPTVATFIRANPARTQAKNKTETWFILHPSFTIKYVKAG